MNVDLTPNDIRILKEALDCWEHEASSQGLMGGMMGVLLCGKDDREAEKERFQMEMNKAKDATKKRRDQCTLIRATLIKAEMQMSEHELAP